MFSPRKIIFALIALWLIVLISFWAGRSGFKPPFGGAANFSGYQAVFLSNGQVYFGRLSAFPGRSPVLKDVFYLQASNPLPPPEASKAPGDKKTLSPTPSPASLPAAAGAPTGSNFALIKLGDEIHGPKDELLLNSDQIVFVENLREDSKVVEAINRYKASQAAKK